MRIFVAIEIPAEIRGRIRELIELLRRAAAPVRWSRPDGLHVTLKFIGEASAERVEQIKAALPSIRIAQPLAIGVRGAGFFPSERSPRVVWLGVHAGQELAQMAARIDEAVSVLGVPRETRPFAPHLTIGRLRVPDPIPAVRELLRGQEPLDLGTFTANEFFLYESKPASGGSIYTKIARYAPAEAGGKLS